jgi:hypothetical protein
VPLLCIPLPRPAHATERVHAGNGKHAKVFFCAWRGAFVPVDVTSVLLRPVTADFGAFCPRRRPHSAAFSARRGTLAGTMSLVQFAVDAAVPPPLLPKERATTDGAPTAAPTSAPMGRVPEGACSADIETVRFWSGGYAGTWPKGKAALWRSFLEAVDGICLFPFMVVGFVERVLVVIFSVVGPCGAVDAERVRLLRDVLGFLMQHVDEKVAGGPSGCAGASPRPRAGEETVVAQRLLHLLRRGCGGASRGVTCDLNVDLLVATSEACVNALHSSRFRMLGVCQATGDRATTFRETCSLGRACGPCCPATYDDGKVFDRMRVILGVMHAASDEKPGQRVLSDRRWVMATLQHLKDLDVDVLKAVRAGEAYKFTRVVRPAGAGATTAGIETFHVFRSGTLMGQVETPMNFTRAPLCQGNGAFIEDVQHHTVWGLLLGSVFKFERCPSSQVTPPAATYVVTEALSSADGTARPVALVFADGWAHVAQSAVVPLGTYASRQLALLLEGAWCARACVNGLCP